MYLNIKELNEVDKKCKIVENFSFQLTINRSSKIPPHLKYSIFSLKKFNSQMGFEWSIKAHLNRTENCLFLN